MKLAFVTDTHFGYRRFDEDALRQGKEAVLAAAREADLLILGGDNFDAPVPRMETVAEVARILREALAIFHSRGIPGMPIFAIHGNHERRARGFVNPTELLAQAGLVAGLHNRVLEHERGGERVVVFGLGSVPDDLAKAALAQVSHKPVEGAFNVFVLHQSFREHDVAGNEGLISFDDLPEGYDLYLCGHVHKPSLSGKVLNPGSTVVTQLKEDEEGKKGWLLYDTAARRGEFRAIASRQLLYSELVFGNATPDEVRAKAGAEAKRLLASEPRGAFEPLVRIVVKGTLAKGFAASDLRLPSLGGNVFFGNAMNLESLKEKIAQIKLSRERKAGPRQQGMGLLGKKLEGTGYSLGDPEAMFEQLLEGSALEGIRRKIEKEAVSA